MRIQRAGITDLDDLRPLLQAYRLFYKQDRDPAGEQRFLQERLANLDSTIFIARSAERAVGFAQLFTTYSSVHLGPSLSLEDLYVDPQARGKGIARALLDRAKAHALQMKATGMFLETAHSNRAAQRVYERAGWQLESVFRKYNCPLEPVQAQ
ncbi:MAG: N-acetyltransferase family protein [Candidatus Baltobacteraceae bacterium]